MSEIFELILRRRNTPPEEMNGKIVVDAIISEMLKAANWAPTHGLTEPWRFTVFSGNGLQQFCEFHAGLFKSETPAEHFAEKKFEKILHRADKASHIIAVGLKLDPKGKIPEVEEICATACAVQNMLLVGTHHGLAVYWGTGGMTYHRKMAEYLEVDKVLGLLFIGYSDLEMKGRRNSGIETKIRSIS